MKMVKSLLLSSAASFVAVAGAQAADLPVKAKPVEYVKVCSLYGAGFFYIPGTDTCIKIGGAVRVQAEVNAGAGGIPVGLGSSVEAPQGIQTRSNTNDTNFRNRIYFSVDARQQTDYGTLRTYFRFGIAQTTPADPVAGATFWDRAFIQFAGFTVGKTLSFYDGVSFATFNYNNPRVMSDSGPAGITVWAYTAQFGNGISATISAEDPDGRAGKTVLNSSVTDAGLNLGAGVTVSNGLAGQSTTSNGFLFPDVVGALRVDQAWGSAQVMGAMHDASGAYYGTSQTTGHPSNAFGWAVGGSLAINLPTFGATSNVNSQPNVDQFQVQAAYGRGAVGYVTNATNTSTIFKSGNQVAAGWAADGIYGGTVAGGTATDVELSTAWSAMAGYQHLWTPNWRTSVYGGYLNVDYSNTAQALVGAAAGTSTGATGWFCTPSCTMINPGFSLWQVGTRTQWNPVSQLDIGVDVLYSRLNGFDVGNATNTISTAAVGARPAGIYTLTDADVWSVMFRVQRNFWP
jgi:hypothetical protein